MDKSKIRIAGFLGILLINLVVSIFSHFILLKYFSPNLVQKSIQSADPFDFGKPSQLTQASQNSSFTPVAGKQIIIQCNKDVQTICDQQVAGVDQESCLQDHFQNVSLDCKKALQVNRDTFFMCMKEIENYCSTAGYGGGRMLKCLRNHFADLSMECQKRVW